MTKAELIAAVAKEAKITKAAAAKVIDSITESIAKDLKRAGWITLRGVGTIAVANRKARIGRNRRTGQEIRIPASKTPKFKPGRALKEAVR